jgi:hypothetical protein
MDLNENMDKKVGSSPSECVTLICFKFSRIISDGNISKVGNRRMVPKNHTRWQYSNRNYVSFHHEGHPLHLQARLRFQPNIQKKENIV